MQATYLLIGRGRLSRHIQTYFAMLGLRTAVWSRSDSSEQLAHLAQNSSHILLLISDPAIESFAREHASLFAGRTVVHMSGALSTALAFGAHPLMTFAGSDGYSRAVYESIPFVVEAGGPALDELLPGVPNSSFVLKPELKTLYHALCVMSGNFTVLLWQKAFADFETRLGLPREVLLPYLQQITRNLVSSPDAALTGPLARRDVATVERHLSSLVGDDFEPVYRSFVRAAHMEV
jgi:predicted short-subunit dehydrogenase-like oxidoreductase (DUF2520 family)